MEYMYVYKKKGKQITDATHLLARALGRSVGHVTRM